MNDAWVDLVPLLGRVLLHFLWQGGLIGVAAAAALFALRHARPQARYLAGCVAMLACVVAPVATFMRLAQTSRAVTTVAGDTFFHATPVAITASPQSSIDGVLPWLVAIWAGGAVVFGVRMLMGVAWVERLRRAAQDDTHGAWQSRIDALAARMGISASVPLRFVDGLASPVTAGWWKPVVLLPTALAMQMPAALVEALIAHELAHIRRHDYIVNLMQSIVEALLFYHPVVWWLSKRVRAERELVADAIAADTIGEPRRLAIALTELSELNAAAPLPRPMLAARGGDLMSRIQNLLRPATPAAGGRLAIPVIALVGLGLAVYAQATVAPQPVKPVAPPTPVAAALPAPKVTNAAIPMTPVAAQAAADAASASIARDPTPSRRPVEPVAPIAPIAPIETRAVERAVEQAIDSQRDAYAGIAQARDSMHAGSMDIDDDVLMFDRDGKRYRVTDPAFVARVNRTWTDTRAIADRMSALGKQMSAHGANMSAIGQSMHEAALDPQRTAAMKAAEVKLNATAQEYGRLAAQAALSDHDAAMDAQLEKLNAEIGRQSSIIAEQARLSTAPMANLERRMNEAAKPMHELEGQMHELEKQERAASSVAQRETDRLIEEAVSRGLAQPIENR
ncbi:M56 family metallopeptidase [Lysobacter sp. HA18]